jgi:hypothetical protein
MRATRLKLRPQRRRPKSAAELDIGKNHSDRLRFRNVVATILLIDLFV